MIDLIPETESIRLSKGQRNRLYKYLLENSNEQEEFHRIAQIFRKYVLDLTTKYMISPDLLEFYKENPAMCKGCSLIKIDLFNLGITDDKKYPSENQNQAGEDIKKVACAYSVTLDTKIPSDSEYSFLWTKDLFNKVPEMEREAFKNISFQLLDANVAKFMFLSKYTLGNPEAYNFDAFYSWTTLKKIYEINPEYYKIAMELFSDTIKYKSKLNKGTIATPEEIQEELGELRSLLAL